MPSFCVIFNQERGPEWDRIWESVRRLLPLPLSYKVVKGVPRLFRMLAAHPGLIVCMARQEQLLNLFKGRKGMILAFEYNIARLRGVLLFCDEVRLRYYHNKQMQPDQLFQESASEITFKDVAEFDAIIQGAVGRPEATNHHREYICRLKREGKTHREIADILNRDGIKTPAGKPYDWQSVRYWLKK